MKKQIGLILTGLIFCTLTMAQTKTIYINSTKKPCVGVGPMSCLQYRNDSAESWKLLYQPIEGFNFEEGFLYTIKVKVQKIDNPPADGSSVKYTLKKVVSKQKDENMQTGNSRALEGKWVISKIMLDGKLVEVGGKAWEMEFRSLEKTINARICNNMGGGFTVDGNGIKFGPMRSTRMTCPDIQYEGAFGKAIMEVDGFHFEKNKLFLKKGNKTLIELYMPV